MREIPVPHANSDDRVVLIVANPYSGSGPNRQHTDRLLDALRNDGLRTQVVWDPQERSTILSAGDLHERYRCVVASGGDGTVADVVSRCRSLPLAMLPMGNENLFAREFGFTRDVRKVTRAIVGGRTRRIDLGRAGQTFFAIMVTAGFDAAVIHALTAWRTSHPDGLHRVQHLSYARPLAETLSRYDYPPLTLTTQEGKQVTGAHALIFNLPQYALGVKFAPEARCDDGMLDWVVFRAPGPLHLLGYASAALTGAHLRLNDVRCGRSARLWLKADRPAPVQADGDALGETPVEISVEPGTLQVIDMRTDGAG